MTGAADRLVEVRDVVVAHPGAAGPVVALRGADLVLAPGERLLLQGPNGCGTSTLLRVIAGEQAVAAGAVTVAGTALHELDAGRRRTWRVRSVGFVDQLAGRGLLPELSVLQNVALQLRLTGVGPAEAERRARATCARLSVAALLDRPVRRLSGGEAQQVAVCAAVAHEPPLLLADQPTAELDERSAGEVHDLLARLAAGGCGVILASHDPRAVGVTDRAVRLRDGRTAERGRPGSAVVERLQDGGGRLRVPWQRGPGPEPVRPPPARPAVAVLARLTGVTAGHGDRALLDRLDLVLRAGTLTVVTGPSGSGRSTLIAVLAGLLPPRAGTVVVGDGGWDGRSRRARAEHRRRWLALLPQRPVLLEALTVRANLLLTAGVRGSVAGERAVGEFADRLALTRLLDQPVQLLSGGERQRSALARALVSAAPLLLLDEPTSQQDASSVDRVLGVLAEETAAGRGVLVASHDPRVAAAATRLVELGRGR